MAQQEDGVTSTHCLYPPPHGCPTKGHFGSKGTCTCDLSRVLAKTSAPALLPDSFFSRSGYLPCAAASLCNVGEVKSRSLWYTAAEQSRDSGSLTLPHHMGLLEAVSAFNQLYLGTEWGGCAGRGERPRQAGITATVSHWLWQIQDGKLKQSLDAVLDPLRMGSEPPQK